MEEVLTEVGTVFLYIRVCKDNNNNSSVPAKREHLSSQKCPIICLLL